MLNSPINKQVLLHPEALCAAVTVGTVVSSELRLGLIAVTLPLRQLCQLIFGGAERSGLLSHTWSVDHQAVLQWGRGEHTFSRNVRNVQARLQLYEESTSIRAQDLLCR